MNLRETILAEHSKKQADKIVHWIGDSQHRFDQLFHLFITDEYRVVQRAAWPLSFAVIQHPQLISPHFGRLLKNLAKKDLHDAVKRNTVRLLQHIAIPAKYHGQVMNICFDYIANPVEKAAIKAFSLTILEHLAVKYPEIKPELKMIIEDRWEYESAAFRSRARKILKK